MELTSPLRLGPLVAEAQRLAAEARADADRAAALVEAAIGGGA